MTDNIEINSDDGTVNAYISKPDGIIEGALILVHEVWGLNEHTKAVADRYAKEGYLVLAPSLLEELNLDPAEFAEIQSKLFDPEQRNSIQPRLRELTSPMQDPEFGRKTVTRLKACFDHLYDMPEFGQRVGIVGFCFGGTYSYTLAVNEPRLKAAVPYYGHCDIDVDDLAKITCPILAFYGENDEALISNLPQLKEKMAHAEVDFMSVIYPNCGHAFFNDTNKFAYNHDAAENSWKKATVFLAKNLKG